jgi:hypothetical protein
MLAQNGMLPKLGTLHQYGPQVREICGTGLPDRRMRERGVKPHLLKAA